MTPLDKQVAKVPLVLQKMPFWDWAVGKLLYVSEGQNGLSWMSFLRDTSVAWLPKIVVSRSLIEISESTFLEFLESGVVYFSVPLAAKGLHNFFFNQARKTFTGGVLDKKLLQKPVSKLLYEAGQKGGESVKKQLPHILSVKAATILGPMVAVGLGCEYLINYGKNLMTAHFFKKDKFSDVVNLSKGQMKSGEKSEVVNKSIGRALVTLGLMMGTLGASALLARFGHRLPTSSAKPYKNLLKNLGFVSAAKQTPDDLMAAVVKHLDFDANKGGFSLSGNQLRWYMLASIPAYADAARDKYERVEAVTRLAMIMGYLGFGQQALEKGMLAVIKRYRPSLYKAMTATTEAGKRQVMKLDQVAEKVYDRVATSCKGQFVVSDQANDVLAKADYLTHKVANDAEFKQAVTAKNVLFGVPMVVGILGTGIGVSLLNQFWTKYRFQKAQQGLAIPPNPKHLPDELKAQIAQLKSPAPQPVSGPVMGGAPVRPMSGPFVNPAMAGTGGAGYNAMNRYSLPL